MPKYSKKSQVKQPSLFESPVRYFGSFQIELTDGSFWLTQKQIAELFQTDQSGIARHIKNIYATGELHENSTMQKLHNGTSDKPVQHYSLDVIISVGYRVNSVKGTEFRIWATQQLHDLITKGIVINHDSPRVRKLKHDIETLTGMKWDNENAVQHLTLTIALMDSLKAIQAISAQIIIKPLYGKLMNTEYESLFGYTASGLKAILKGNVRETLGNEAMATLLFAETMLTGLLTRSKQISMDEAIAIYIDALKPVRAMHDSLCERFGIHPITSKPLLTSGNK